MLRMSRVLVTLLLLLVATLACSAQDLDLGCYVPGECTEGYSVGIGAAADPEACYNYCMGLANCNHFTLYQETTGCFAYEVSQQLVLTSC